MELTERVRARSFSGLITVPVLGLVAAILLTVTSGEATPTWLEIGGSVLATILYVWLARLAGWWALPVATVALIVVGMSASALFYDGQSGVPPNEQRGGMDGIGLDPGDVVFVLPFVWVVLVAAVLSRRWPRTRRADTAS